MPNTYTLTQFDYDGRVIDKQESSQAELGATVASMAEGGLTKLVIKPSDADQDDE